MNPRFVPCCHVRGATHRLCGSHGQWAQAEGICFPQSAAMPQGPALPEAYTDTDVRPKSSCRRSKVIQPLVSTNLSHISGQLEKAPSSSTLLICGIHWHLRQKGSEERIGSSQGNYLSCDKVGKEFIIRVCWNG